MRTVQAGKLSPFFVAVFIYIAKFEIRWSVELVSFLLCMCLTTEIQYVSTTRTTYICSNPQPIYYQIRSNATMMQDYSTEQAPVVAGNAEGDDKKKGQNDFIDTVCDPCGLVPDNLEEALAYKKKMKLEKAQEEQAAKNVDPEVQIPEEKNDADADANAVDSMLSNFDLDCCGNAPAATDEVEDTEVPEEQFLKNGDSASVMTGNNSQHSNSLADIAANMDDIDLESTAGDQKSEGGDNSIFKLDKDQPWYKQKLYAALIILCGTFSIAIIVMAILLIVNKQ